jgi:hypothetical protein
VVGQQRAGRGLQLGPVGRARRPQLVAAGSDPLVDGPELVRDAPDLASATRGSLPLS